MTQVYSYITKMANTKFNYQFMFSARLILGNKVDASYFIYTTKKPPNQTNQKIKIPNNNNKLSEKRETLHRFLQKFRHKKYHFTCVFLIENTFSHFCCQFLSCIMFLLSILLRFYYSEACLFTRLFFGQFLFMSYHNPFWFLCTFPCGVLGNTQSVYYNLGTVRVKENINIVAELSATYYAIFTDLHFYLLLHCFAPSCMENKVTNGELREIMFLIIILGPE